MKRAQFPTDERPALYLRVEPRMLEAVRRAAKREDRTIAAWVRRAIEAKLREAS